MLCIDELLSKSDFVSLHCPSTKETQGLINFESLSKMRSSAYLINTARGDIVVEDDLAKALDQKIIMYLSMKILMNSTII